MNNPNANPRNSENDELLTQYGLAHLPELFAMRDEENRVIQEKEPCYNCQADVFIGRSTHGTRYAEGSIIVTDVIPNQHMEPLNRAAAIRYARWMGSLPANGAQIDVGDMSEAAQMLAKDPKALALDPLAWQEAVTKLASRLKLKREGKDARSLPDISHNFIPQSGGKAPPILGAKVSDMAQTGPGQTRFSAAAPPGAAGVRRASLGGPPPGL